MQEIGEFLKDAREAQGMTLEDVESATRIRRRYLEAIENGDFSQVPGEVQLRGFIRNYAAAVGLEPSAVIGRYLESRGAAAVGEETLEGTKTEILVVEERRPGKLLFIALLVLLVLAAGALYYLFVYSGRLEDPLSRGADPVSDLAEVSFSDDALSQALEQPSGIDGRGTAVGHS